jgi:hypothetical protein
MAKRYIDTELFDDEWFMDLSPEGKILWIYCITKCDHAGLLKWNSRLVKVHTGIEKIETVIKELNKSLVRVKEGLYFLPKFFEYQYPNFPRNRFRAADSAAEKLVNLGLMCGETLTIIEPFYFEENKDLNKTSLTLKEDLAKSPSKSNSKSNSIKGGSGGKKDRGTLMKDSGVTLEDISSTFRESDDLKVADPVHYFNAAMDWSRARGERRIDWIATVRNFARRDLSDGKMRLRHVKRENDRKFEFAPLKKGDPMPESLKRKYGIKSDDEKQANVN